MKIIDLLNKIANGEEVPKKIKFMGNEFIWRQDLVRYILVGCEDGNIAGHTLTDMRNIFACLHDTVEIIEEEKKIPEKLDIEDDGNTITLFGEKENEWTILDNVDVIICNKINSIIDYLKSKGE